MPPPPPELSIVVPFHNEAECLPLLHERLREALDALGLSHEILYVDDGSTDGSLEIIRRLRDRDASVAAVVLARNFGQQAALTAGLSLARGQAAITLDADLQHPPELLAELVAAWRRGAKVVHAVRRGTIGAGPLKRLTSSAYYRLLGHLCDVSPRSDAADFRLLDRQALDALATMHERHRFLRGMIGWLGLPEDRIFFTAPPRAAGSPKFGWTKMIRLAVDGVVSSSIKPLRLSLWLGLAALAVDAAYASYVVGVAWKGDVVRGWSSLVLVSLFLGGVQLLVLGVMGEYLGRIYEEVKARPHFVLRELLPARLPPA